MLAGAFSLGGASLSVGMGGDPWDRPSPSRAFAEGLQPLLDILTEAVSGPSKRVRRRKAVATMATLVGAVTLARAVGDQSLSDEILDAARCELLATAGA